MKREHILIGVAWLATVIVAYFVGSSGDPSKAHASANGSAQNAGAAGTSAGTGADARGQRSFLRKGDELDDSALGPNGKPNVVALIARARQQFSGGMGGMMNMRAMLRAIAPLAELDDSQLQEALAEVEKTAKEPQQRMMFYSLLLGQWAETDGKAALAYADEKLGGGSPFDFGVRASILGSWARRDPDGVWRWYQNDRKDDGNDRNKGMLVSMMFAGMASNDLDTALQRVATLDDASRGMAMQGIAQSASNETTRKRLLERSATLPSDQKQQIRQGIVSQWAMMDPDATVKWIQALPADEQKPMRDSAANMIMMTKPALGAELMMQGVEEKDKPQAYDRVVGQWAWQDQKGAGEWLTKQPQGPELDGARSTYARVVAQKDPAAAMDWARSVQNPEQRTQSVEQVYQQWRTRDGAAAEAALDASDLPPEKIKQLKQNSVPVKNGTGVLKFP